MSRPMDHEDGMEWLDALAADLDAAIARRRKARKRRRFLQCFVVVLAVILANVLAAIIIMGAA